MKARSASALSSRSLSTQREDAQARLNRLREQLAPAGEALETAKVGRREALMSEDAAVISRAERVASEAAGRLEGVQDAITALENKIIKLDREIEAAERRAKAQHAVAELERSEAAARKAFIRFDVAPTEAAQAWQDLQAAIPRDLHIPANHSNPTLPSYWMSPEEIGGALLADAIAYKFEGSFSTGLSKGFAIESSLKRWRWGGFSAFPCAFDPLEFASVPPPAESLDLFLINHIRAAAEKARALPGSDPCVPLDDSPAGLDVGRAAPPVVAGAAHQLEGASA